MSSVRNRQWLLATLMIVAAIWFPAANRSRPAHKSLRTIVVTAKDMQFNLTKPDMPIAPGESIRIILHNDDPGMKHDLVLPDLGIRTPLLKAGEQATLEFIMPDSGVLEYFCSLHPVSMSGFLGGPAPREENRLSLSEKEVNSGDSGSSRLRPHPSG